MTTRHRDNHKTRAPTPKASTRLIASGHVVADGRGDYWRVELDGNHAVVLCSISGRIRRSRIKLVIGDAVDVELNEYSKFERGRIVYRQRDDTFRPA